ncbi:MAG: AmmeMemoRadiSam system protein B [Candidatus Bathyarchaeia archaeon]
MRYPRQAGQFYEGTPDALRAQIEGCFTHRLGPGRLPKVTERPFPNPLALVSPHAGYMFSGPVAAHGYYEAAVYGKPEAVIIIGPNHTGMGSGVSIVTNGWWRTPLGDIKVNRDLAERILTGSGIIDIDEHAHLFEHSIEVQLPFLQYIYGSDLTFIPICMMLQDLQTSREVGIALAKALTGSNVLLIASTDLTHYEPQKVAEAKDSVVIDAIVHLDEAELQHVIEAKNVTMCGYGPVSVVIVAMKELGGRKSRLLSYHTSGDVTKDYAQVVGYCSIAIS